MSANPLVARHSDEPAAPLPANVAYPCTEELAQINESLQRRESLLAASARASRLLLEAPDVMGAIPDVLRLIGDAAGVDRVNLMLSEPGPAGEPLLVVVSEWVAEGVVSRLGSPNMGICDERHFASVCAELRSGRTVCINKEDLGCGTQSCDSDRYDLEGIGTKTKAIVPIFVDSEYLGIVGFDNCQQRRAIDSAELSALETAAGVIGAALHREKLLEAVRRERERAVEERVGELAKANAAIRTNLERLAKEPDLRLFLGHLLLEATRQVDAASGAVLILDDASEEWHLKAHVRNGQLEPPPFPTVIACDEMVFGETMRHERQPVHLVLKEDSRALWPGAREFHETQGHASVFIQPLIFGERVVGMVGLGFIHLDMVNDQRTELLVALAQQATLAIELTRRARSAQRAAVLMERNRIGQEIHDGLAQAFTGILMQLGAAEELEAFEKDCPYAVILSRIRDLAREGLGEARRSVMALRPDQTRRRGLEIALRQLAERSTLPGRITCTFEGGGFVTGLAPEHEHELLRIAQEAVSNAMRHAQASLVKVLMVEESDHWAVAVADNGRGMGQRPELYAQRGFGLTSMRERALAIGGQWQIDSRQGEGTRVSVRLPKRKVQ